MRLLFTLFLLVTSVFQQGLAQQGVQKGLRHLKTSEFDSARIFFQKMLDTCQTCHDTDLAYINIYLAKTYQQLYKHDTALLLYKQGIEIFETNDIVNGEAFGIISLAEYYRFVSRYDMATELLEKAVELNKRQPLSPNTLAYLYNRYAAVVNETTGNFDQVVNYSQKAIVLAKQTGDRDLEASSYNELGFLHQEVGDNKALNYYRNALTIYEEMNNTRYIANVLSNISRALYRDKRYAESLYYSKKGIEVCDKNGWVSLAQLYYYQYRNYEALRQYKNAFFALKRYYKTVLSIREAKWNKALVDVEGKYKLIEKEKEIKEAEQQATLATIETENRTIQRNFLVIIGVLLTFITGMLYWSYRKITGLNVVLNTSLKQKETLLQEVHHRVKNNLTLLTGLLYLRSRASSNTEVRAVLDECQARIHSMALVHQYLYDVDDLSEVDFNDFIQQLFDELESMFNQSNSRIKVNIETNRVLLRMREAIFIGLITNELATNSYKYAFQNTERKEINIQLLQNDKELILSYSDSGVGLPEKFDMNHSGGFGFRLVNIIIDQINARMTYEKGRLNTFTIFIPYESTV